MIKRIFKILVVLLLSLIEFLIMEISATSLDYIINLCPKKEYMLVAVGFFVSLNCLLNLIFHRIEWIGNVLALLMSTILSLACYFTYRFHGIPFSFVEIKNAKTAGSVLSGYLDDIFTYNERYKEYIILVAIAVFLICINELNKNRVNIKLKTVFLAMAVSGTIYGYSFVIPANAVGWNWMEGIYLYGYFNCLVQESIAEMTPIKKLDGVDTKSIESYMDSYEVSDTGDNTPDVMIILNESFYDLNQVLDINNSEDPITYIPTLENVLTGYAVVPNVGGGTNDSEYELLTSNSLALMHQSATPFQVLNLAEANSVVSHLENLGYETLGTHDCFGINYSRSRGYEQLGFDEIYFENEYEDLESWGNRVSDASYTDESQYRNIIRWYEEMGEGPRFLYALTLQNHGSWTYNAPEDNIIQSDSEYVDFNSQISEYNSCIYLSDKALQYLFDYYNNIDRDVIVLMVGDHCPHILPSIMDEYYPDYDRDMKELVTRRTPYVIWSNNSDLLVDKRPQETLGLVYMVPTLLEAGGIQSSDYYDFMIHLRDELPIITKYGVYYDKTGKMYSYDDRTPYSDLMNEYFQIEYANLKTKLKYKEFFD
ncbi:Phosphoglycerol transferase MdoB [Pseudobutyrivibrio sp. 49]|uniref:LTA synthase family protein n=1 Tax=Pseudobutyrivibrio sp. 49 TaxID=1855344 RepID=UPI000887F136|nr:LTA synthase family protein [Pseudobutyrivibrio sp. 49]SDH59539.1 Phosphoglycerol transferase MdoB [Pseudobutyrivibrio sp. 49]